MMRSLVLLAVLPSCCVGRSVQSCGGSEDRLRNASITLSPDPMVSGQPFTFELTGELDDELTELFANVDLNIQFLSIISRHVTTRVRISGSPGLAKGPWKAVVGPLVLDMGWVPVSIDISGTVKLVDTKENPVACIKLTKASFGKAHAEEKTASMLDGGAGARGTQLLGDYTRSCGTPKDHVQHLKIAVSDTKTEISGTSDEAFTDMKLSSTTTVSKGWFFSKTIKVDTPIHLSPGIPAGPFELNFEVQGKPPKKWGLTNTGKLTLTDQENEQMVCVEYEGQTAAAEAELAVVV